MTRQIIPVDNTGSRKITVDLGENSFRIRTYYLPYIRRWIMDIYDTDENPIIVGICLNTGVENLVKGKSALFENQAIRCISIDGSQNNTPDSLGKTCFIVYYGKNDTQKSLHEDKMLG